MPLYELRLVPRQRTAAALPVLGALLAELGVPPSELIEQTIDGKPRLSLYLASAAEARRRLSQLRAARLRRVAITLRPVRDSDWKDPWKRHLRPFAITRDLRVVPAWSPEARKGANAARIVLETGMAFGTGKHATTHWMADCLARLRGRYEHVLDVGAGTGVLAIVACRYGARRVLGIEIDPEAAKVARRNAAVNGCRQVRIRRADFGRLAPAGRYDVVVANIGSTELLAMRQRLIDAVNPGGFLAVTGMLRSQAAGFRRGFDHPSLRCVRTLRDREWAGFLYQRRRADPAVPRVTSLTRRSCWQPSARDRSG